MKTFILFLTALAVAQAPLRAQLPTITNQPANQVVLAGGNATFSAGVSGTGPFTYQWQFDGRNLPNSNITTVAGDGIDGFSGNGGAATNARLYYPPSVVVDVSGNLFIADQLNDVIREVNSYGIITTVAGIGEQSGYSGDGGAATSAKLSGPYCVLVDASGNLLIADSGNDVIRKVSTNGIITTVAGNGTAAYSGDGGAATNAELNTPAGIVLDASGNLFIADQVNYVIRKVSTNGIITTVAGDGTPGFSGDGGPATHAMLYNPASVVVDASGNLYIADQGNAVIRKVSTNGIITTVAGIGGQLGYTGDGGPATNATLESPSGAALDASGNLYIADPGNDVIRKVSTNGIITTVAGNGGSGYSGDGGPATNAALNAEGMTVDAYDNLFIADTFNSVIRKITNTQGPVLKLNDVTDTNAGNYQVVVTGSGGSVTSSVATLTLAVTPAPFIYRIVRNSDGSVTIYATSQANSTNVVLGATSLFPSVLWQPVSTNMAGANGNWQYTDTNAASYHARFYRAFTLLPP